jgi:hypothetical protein
MRYFTTLVIALAGFCFGCASTNPSITPASVAADSQLVASTGATFAMSRDTNAADYLKASLQVLNVALNTGQYSPAALQSALSSISTSALRDPAVVQFLPLALAGLQTVEGQNIASGITSNQYLAAALTGIRNGLAQSLGLPPIPLPSAVPTAAVGGALSPAATNTVNH